MKVSFLTMAVSVFVAPSVLPSVVMGPKPFGKITTTVPKAAQVPALSAEVYFLRRGFLKPSSFVFRAILLQ